MSIPVSNQTETVHTVTKRYMPGLDGLRALSILAVIAYHLNFPWASGGFLGVGIFFTLSGYLITDQLLMEWSRTGKISLKDFWVRRIRRIIPAMLLLLAAVYLWFLLLDPARLEALKGDFISTLFYYNNWWKIFHNVSYFERFGPQSPLGHLWSLAIEEQFYILWPAILLIGLRFSSKRNKLAAFISVGAIASIIAMELIYVPGSDPSRVYYGTDTRAFALLIGALFAVIYPSCKLSEQISARQRLAIDIVGGTGLLGILILIWKTNEYQASLYVQGLLILSVISAVVTVVLAHPAGRVARFMGCKPLKWIGVRSYSLYLWHYPVIILTTPSVDTGEINVSRLVLQLAACFLISEFSWKFIENPIRHGGFIQKRGNKPVFVSPVIGNSLLFITIALSSIYLTYYTTASGRKDSSLAAMPAAEKQVQSKAAALDNDLLPLLASVIEERVPDIPEKTVKEQNSNLLQSEDQKPSAQALEEQIPAGEPASEQNAIIQPSKEQNTAADIPLKKADAGNGILVIGDSIIINAVPYLEELLPGIIVDGKVSRQMSQAQEVIDQYQSSDSKFDCIVIELGTNGPFNIKQLRQLLSSLAEIRQIILVNTRVPRNWQDIVNSDLEKVSAEFSNVTIADWFSASKGKDSYFYDDGVHLKPEGASNFALVIANALKK